MLLYFHRVKCRQLALVTVCIQENDLRMLCYLFHPCNLIRV